MSNDIVRETIHNALKRVKAPAKFATGGRAVLPLPGLSVSNCGAIALPLQPAQAEALLTTGEQAPFGRGADTVVDLSVRRCRQIDARDIQLNDLWRSAVADLAVVHAANLGISKKMKVEAQLYKMVIYPPGGFFRPHRDTEKAPGMFATLVVQLPSLYTGGELLVRHARRQEVFSFEKESDTLFYSAVFYADCTHELRDVVSGHRLCLLYNLVCHSNRPLPSLADQDGIFNDLVKAADIWTSSGDHEGDGAGAVEDDNKPEKLVLALEHRYTKTNLKFSQLKGKDATLASTLRDVCRFDLHLALVTKHETGSAAYEGYGESHRYGHWSDSDANDCGNCPRMEDVHDTNFEIVHCVGDDDAPSGLTSAMSIDMTEGVDMLDGEPLFGEFEDPDQAEYEDYTGNAGPTVDYWYHRAILMLWPRDFSLDVAMGNGFPAVLSLLRRRIAQNENVAADVLSQIMVRGKERPDSALPHSATLLAAAVDLKQGVVAQSVLSLMSRVDKVVPDPYSTVVPRSNGGICSEAHVKSVTKAVRVFGWAVVGNGTLSAVDATIGNQLGFCGDLACMLAAEFHVTSPDAEADSNDNAAASDAVVKRVAARVLQTECREVMSDEAVEALGRMVFTLPHAAPLRNVFTSKLSVVGAKAVARTIVSLREVCEERSDEGPTEQSGSAMHPHIVHMLHAFVKTAFQGGKVIGKETTTVTGQMWQMALVLKPRDDGLLATFAKAAISTQCGAVLQTMLGENVRQLAGDPYLAQVATARCKQLRYARPTFSFRQPNACVPGHPEVTAFLRSGEQNMTYYGPQGVFNGIRHARNFANKHFGWGRMHSVEKHSATATEGGRGPGAFVVIRKTDGLYKASVQAYERDQKELGSLGVFLNPLEKGVETAAVLAVGAEGKSGDVGQVDVVDLT